MAAAAPIVPLPDRKLADVCLLNYAERETADDVVEYLTEVLGVANELLADKLKLICSSILRRFGESRLLIYMFFQE